MGLGKQIRMQRLFAHPSHNLCSIAIDHFIGYNVGLPPGLRHTGKTLDAIMSAQPDAVTMHKGIASSLWGRYAGQAALIVQTSAVRADDSAMVELVTVEEAIRLGADALAVAAFLRGSAEAHYIKVVADFVREGAKWELPIICHVYPRDAQNNVVYHPEDIAWVVHCMVEAGVDIVKVPYCGDPAAHAQIVADCPVPMVAAGGPKQPTLRDALNVLAEAVSVGVRGGTVGRNVWGSADIPAAVRAYKAVIHDGVSADEAVRLSGAVD
ncbi:MAG: aldolase [Anaerolineae bacterium]|nr:aldolase [Anaerolineae bacterium]